MNELQSYRDIILSTGVSSIADEMAGGGQEHRRTNTFLEFVRRVALNKAAVVSFVVIIVIAVCSISAPVLAPEGYDAQDLRAALQAPSTEHWFGTDHLGRDILSRILWGSRYSLSVGLVAILLAGATGVILGLISGYFGGLTDSVIMRVCDVFMAIPQLLLAICISASLGAGLFNLLLATSISTIPGFTRMCRASVMSVREQEFTEAARCSGAGSLRIMLRYILPNILSPIIVQITMGIAGTILVASSMSFLGLGLQPPAPEWGAMLSVSCTYVRRAPWTCLFPGLAIMVTVLAFNLLGDGMRDALDPKLKR